MIKPLSERQAEFMARQAKKIPSTCFECKNEYKCWIHGLSRGHERCKPEYKEDIPFESR